MTLGFFSRAGGPLSSADESEDLENAIGTFLWSDRGLIFSGNEFYEARLLNALTVSQSAFDRLALGGRVALTASQAILWNGDRSLDSVASLQTALARRAVIKTTAVTNFAASDCGGDLDDAAIVFTGVVAALGAAGRTIALAFGDFSERLNVPLQPTRYTGAGGTGGPEELKGLPKPVSLGWRYNVTPVYIGLVDFGDGSLPTYQTHWRAIAEHTAVRERGVVMVEVGSSPGSGEWRDWPEQGCFQLGFTPDNGIITCDVAGDNVGGYAGTTCGVIERLLTSLGPSLGSDEIDNTSFSLVATKLGGEIGWGIDTTAITALEAVTQILVHTGAIMSGNRAGKARIAVLAPASTTPQLTLSGIPDICALEVLELPRELVPTPQAVSVTAARNWTPLTDIAGIVTGSERDALAGSGAKQRATDSAVAARLAMVAELRYEGLYRLTSDALARAQTILSWAAAGLKAFSVTTDRYLNQIEIGHYARITYPFYGLDVGFTGVVVAWEEMPALGRVRFVMVG